MIKNKKITFNSLKLFIFFMYNMAYVLYMTGHIGRIYNLLILGFFIALCIYQYLYKKRNGVLIDNKVKFLNEFKAALLIVVAFFLISLAIQIYHGDIRKYLLSELLYNIIPPVLALFWINTANDEKELKPYFYIFFIRAVLLFLMNNSSYLTLNNVMSISWSNSKSSIFETSLAHDFLFLEIIFLYLKKPKHAIICMLFCLLSFKRISFILSFLILVGYYIFGRKKSSQNFLNKAVSKKVRVITFIVMCLMPLFLNWVISDSGIEYFNNKGIDINSFTTGRVNIVRYVKNNIGYFNGYGSSDAFLASPYNIRMSTIENMHCDFLKVFYELTFIGVVVFNYCMIYIAKKKRIVFFMLLYIFMEMISSHFLDALSVWNIFFMFAAYIYAKDFSLNGEGNIALEKK